MNTLQFNKLNEKKSRSALFCASLTLTFIFSVTVLTFAFLSYLPYKAYFFYGSFFSREMWTVLLPSAVLLPLAVVFCDITVRRFGWCAEISLIALGIAVCSSRLLESSDYFAYILPGLIFLILPFVVFYFIRVFDFRKNKVVGRVFLILYLVFSALFLYAVLRAALRGNLVQIKLLFVAPFAMVGVAFFAFYSLFTEKKTTAFAISMLCRCTLCSLYCIFLGVDTVVGYILAASCLICFIFDIVCAVFELRQ